MRKLMFLLIALLAVFNLISAYASYNNERADSLEKSKSSQIIFKIDNN